MILGVTGTNGAGKGVVVDYLVKKHGFTHYSTRAAITEEIVRRGLPVNRDTMNEVATDLRRINVPHYYSDLFIARAKEEGVTDFIMESVRAVSEVQNIKAHGGFLLVVDAPEEIRYQRITGRGTETDQVSFEEFQRQEAREMDSEKPGDPSYMDLRSVIRMADATVVNDGTLDELYTQIEVALTKLRNS